MMEYVQRELPYVRSFVLRSVYGVLRQNGKSHLTGTILTTVRTAILFTRWRTRPWGTEKKRLPS